MKTNRDDGGHLDIEDESLGGHNRQCIFFWCPSPQPSCTESPQHLTSYPLLTEWTKEESLRWKGERSWAWHICPTGLLNNQWNGTHETVVYRQIASLIADWEATAALQLEPVLEKMQAELLFFCHNAPQRHTLLPPPPSWEPTTWPVLKDEPHSKMDNAKLTTTTASSCFLCMICIAICHVSLRCISNYLLDYSA